MQVGDKVRIVNGSLKGHLGTIHKVHSSGGYYVRIDDGSVLLYFEPEIDPLGPLVFIDERGKYRLFLNVEASAPEVQFEAYKDGAMVAVSSSYRGLVEAVERLEETPEVGDKVSVNLRGEWFSGVVRGVYPDGSIDAHINARFPANSWKPL